VFELIVIDDALRDALRRGEPADALRRRAHTSDHVTLAERLQVLVSAGLVTAAEAARLA